MLACRLTAWLLRSVYRYIQVCKKALGSSEAFFFLFNLLKCVSFDGGVEDDVWSKVE